MTTTTNKLYLVEDTTYQIMKVCQSLEEANNVKIKQKEKNPNLTFQTRVITFEALKDEVNNLAKKCKELKELFIKNLTLIFNNILRNNNIEKDVSIYMVAFSNKEITLDVSIGFRKFRLSNVFWIKEGEEQSPTALIISPMTLANHDRFTDNGDLRAIDILIGEIWKKEDYLLKFIFGKLDNVIFIQNKIYNEALEIAKFIRLANGGKDND